MAYRKTWIAFTLVGVFVAACTGSINDGDGDSNGPDGGTDAGGADGSDSGTGGSGPVVQPPSETLPLEVLGDGAPSRPVVAQATLKLEEADRAATTTLFFQCHRCGFYAAPEFEKTNAAPIKVKASVRLAGGKSDAELESVPWLDVTDSTVTLESNAALHGGINGGLYTTRVTVTLSADDKARLIAGDNRVQFRFNGSDGESNGFRVLKLELRSDAGVSLGELDMPDFDPKTERDAEYSADDAAAGKALWYSTDSLTKSALVDRTIHAACASCHASNGRDLQYFNYSNNSIVQRSRFHGLSTAQGKQIAAFIRSSLADTVYAERARPWNPPYQPGPGLDAKPAEWGAGAGLAAVLESPEDAVKALFGRPLDQPLNVSQADVDAVMNADATLNAREIQIPLQYPDWNAWLPSIHPSDVWPVGGSGDAVFEAGGGSFPNGDKDVYKKYNELKTWLDTNKNPEKPGDYSHLTADQSEQIMSMFYIFGWEGYNYLGGGRGNHIATTGKNGAQAGGENLQALVDETTAADGKAGAFTTNSFIERATASMLHWLVIKQWEMAQDYQLEGNQTWFIGTMDKETGVWKGRGEAHGWPFNTVSLFFLAPHMVYQTDTDTDGKVTREWYTAWEADNIVGSYYRSNQWYQLQMSVNPGGQSGWVNFPMDWPYLTAFDDYLAMKVGDATPEAKAWHDADYVRLLQARIKSAQYVNNDIVLWDPAQPDLFANAGRYGRAQVAKHLAVANFVDQATDQGNSGSKYKFLEDYQAGIYLKVVNGAIQQFTSLYADTKAADWRRCDPSNTQLGEPEHIAGFRYCLDVTKKALGDDGAGGKFMHTESYRAPTEQAEQYGLWKATQLGAEAGRLQVWNDWIEAMW